MGDWNHSINIKATLGGTAADQLAKLLAQINALKGAGTGVAGTGVVEPAMKPGYKVIPGMTTPTGGAYTAVRDRLGRFASSEKAAVTPPPVVEPVAATQPVTPAPKKARSTRKKQADAVTPAPAKTPSGVDTTAPTKAPRQRRVNPKQADAVTPPQKVMGFGAQGRIPTTQASAQSAIAAASTSLQMGFASSTVYGRGGPAPSARPIGFHAAFGPSAAPVPSPAPVASSPVTPAPRVSLQRDTTPFPTTLGTYAANVLTSQYRNAVTPSNVRYLQDPNSPGTRMTGPGGRYIPTGPYQESPGFFSMSAPNMQRMVHAGAQRIGGMVDYGAQVVPHMWEFIGAKHLYSASANLFAGIAKPHTDYYKNLREARFSAMIAANGDTDKMSGYEREFIRRAYYDTSSMRSPEQRLDLYRVLAQKGLEGDKLTGMAGLIEEYGIATRDQLDPSQAAQALLTGARSFGIDPNNVGAVRKLADMLATTEQKSILTQDDLLHIMGGLGGAARYANADPQTVLALVGSMRNQGYTARESAQKARMLMVRSQMPAFMHAKNIHKEMGVPDVKALWRELNFDESGEKIGLIDFIGRMSKVFSNPKAWQERMLAMGGKLTGNPAEDKARLTQNMGFLVGKLFGRELVPLVTELTNPKFLEDFKTLRQAIEDNTGAIARQAEIMKTTVAHKQEVLIANIERLGAAFQGYSVTRSVMGMGPQALNETVVTPMLRAFELADRSVYSKDKYGNKKTDYETAALKVGMALGFGPAMVLKDVGQLATAAGTGTLASLAMMVSGAQIAQASHMSSVMAFNSLTDTQKAASLAVLGKEGKNVLTGVPTWLGAIGGYLLPVGITLVGFMSAAIAGTLLGPFAAVLHRIAEGARDTEFAVDTRRSGVNSITGLSTLERAKLIVGRMTAVHDDPGIDIQASYARMTTDLKKARKEGSKEKYPDIVARFRGDMERYRLTATGRSLDPNLYKDADTALDLFKSSGGVAYDDLGHLGAIMAIERAVSKMPRVKPRSKDTKILASRYEKASSDYVQALRIVRNSDPNAKPEKDKRIGDGDDNDVKYKSYGQRVADYQAKYDELRKLAVDTINEAEEELAKLTNETVTDAGVLRVPKNSSVGPAVDDLNTALALLRKELNSMDKIHKDITENNAGTKTDAVDNTVGKVADRGPRGKIIVNGQLIVHVRADEWDGADRAVESLLSAVQGAVVAPSQSINSRT